MSQRRKYSKEFKLEAVNLANEPGVTLNKIAQELVNAISDCNPPGN